MLALFPVIAGLPGHATSAVEQRELIKPQEIALMFAGKTWKWPEGSAFFGRKGTFQATKYLRESAGGYWYVSEYGSLCAKANWNTVYTQTPFARCWVFSRSADGSFWFSERRTTYDWQRFQPEKELTSGNINRHEFEYARIPRKLIESRFLAPREVEALYTNKVWLWEEGLAVFGRLSVFNAVTTKNEKAEGRWFIESDGKVCYEAKWTGPNGSSMRKDCWMHALDKKNRLWQTPASDPEGWYRFNSKSLLKPINKTFTQALLYGYDAGKYRLKAATGE